MAVELATAYVSLVASGRGISASIAEELGRPLERAAKVAGQRVIDAIGREIAVGAKTAGADAGASITDALRKAVAGFDAPTLTLDDVPAPLIGQPVIPEPTPLNLEPIRAPKVGQPVVPEPDLPSLRSLPAPEVGKPSIPEPDTSEFLSGAQKAGVAAGGAVAAGLAVGFLSSAGAEVTNDKLAGQLGINNPSFAADLGKVAGRVYVANFGENLGQVNEAIRGVLQNGLVPEDATNAQIESITAKVLGLAATFDQDLGGATAAVGQLIKTGLAANADEAIDIIVRGFQQGADKGGDLLDTLNEYGTQFRSLGIDAATATGILSQGLKAGARDSDVVADAIKEFAIRAVDGSKTTAEGFAAVGLNAAEMANQIGKGGPEAAAGLDTVLDRLRDMPDPVARAAAATALFGTQSEDLKDALFALDPSRAVDALGDVAGAADRMNEVVGDNAAGAFESFKRTVETKLAGVVGAFAPALQGIISIGPALGGLAIVADKLPLKEMASKMLDVGKSALASAGHVVASTASFVAQKVAMVAGAVATKAVAAAQWLLNAALAANPIGLVVIAVAALVAGLVLAYKHSETFRNIVSGAFELVLKVAQAAFGWIKDNWDLLLAILTGPFGLAIVIVRRFGDDILGFFKGLPGRIAGAVGDLFGFLKTQMTAAKDWIAGRVSDVVGFFTGLPARFGSAAGDVFGFIRESFKSAINWIIKKWNGLEFGIPGFDPPGPGPKFPGFKLGVPDIPLLHAGGIVPGRPGADVLALLQAGERVIPTAQVPQTSGRGLSLDGLNLNVSVLHEEDTPLEISRSLGNLMYLVGA